MIRLCAFADEYGISFAEQVEGLKRNEIDLIELRGMDGKNVADLTEAEAEAYAERFAAEGISVWSLGSPLGKAEITVDMDGYMQKVAHCCRLAEIFRAKYIRVFSFFNGYDQKEKVFATLERMVKIADEYGVTLCHENEKDIYGDTLARVLEIYERVKGLAFVYDPANYLQVGESAAETLAAMLDKTTYFHVKDVIAKTGELVPAGYGDGRIADLLRKVKGDFTFTLEPHLAVFEGYAAIDGTQMKNKLHFASNAEAFTFAVEAFKKLLVASGYQKIGYNGYGR